MIFSLSLYCAGFTNNPPIDLKFRCIFNNVTIDHYPLQTDLLEQIAWKSKTTPTKTTPQAYTYLLKNKTVQTSTAPLKTELKVGDYRLRWACYGGQNDEVTVLAKMVNNELSTFKPSFTILWKNLTADNLSIIRYGQVSKESLFLNYESDLQKWRRRGLRVGLFFAVVCGFFDLRRRIQFNFTKRSLFRGFCSTDFLSGLCGLSWCLMIVTVIWIAELPICGVLYGFYLIVVCKIYCSLTDF